MSRATIGYHAQSKHGDELCTFHVEPGCIRIGTYAVTVEHAVMVEHQTRCICTNWKQSVSANSGSHAVPLPWQRVHLLARPTCAHRDYRHMDTLTSLTRLMDMNDFLGKLLPVPAPRPENRQKYQPPAEPPLRALPSI